MVTVDAPGAEIVDLAGLQVRQRAIDQAAVGQLATGIEVGRTLAGDLTRGCVGDVLGVEVEVATAHDTLVVEVAGQVQRQRAVGDPFATMAHALLQGKAEVTLRMHLAVFAEHTCHQGLAAISAQQATAVGDVVRLAVQVAAGADHAAGVLQLAVDLQPRTAIGDDLALAVVQPLCTELQLARLQPTRAVAATGVAVVHAGGREGQPLAGRDRAGGVVHVPVEGQVEVASGLHATTGIGQARRPQRKIRSAGKCSTGAVVDAGQEQTRIALCIDCAATVAQHTAFQLQLPGRQQPTAAGRETVVDVLPGRVDGQVGRRLHATALVVQNATVHTQRALLRTQRAGAVVQPLAAGLDVQLATQQRAPLVVQAVTLQLQPFGGLHRAVAVVHACRRGHRQVLASDQGAVAVVETAGVQGHHAGAGQQALLAIVETTVNAQHQRAAARVHCAALVTKAGRGDRAGTAEQDAALLVVQRLADRQRGVPGACALQRALRIDQLLRDDIQRAIAGERTAAIVQHTLYAQAQRIFTGCGERATGGGQGVGADGDATRRGGRSTQIERGAIQHEAAVAEHAAALAQQGLRRDLQLATAGVLDPACTVVQRPGQQGQVAIAGQRTTGIAQRRRLDATGAFAAGDDAATGVVERGGLKVEAIGAQRRVTMIHVVGAQGQCGRGDQRALAAVQAAGGDVQALVAGLADAAATVVQPCGGDRQAVGVAGDRAFVIVQRTDDLQRAVGRSGAAERARAVDQFTGLHIQCPVAGDRAATVVHALRHVQPQRVAAGRAEVATGVVQALRIDGNALCLGSAAGPQQQVAALKFQRRLAEDAAARTLQAVGADLQRTAAGVFDCTAAVVQACRLQPQITGTGQAAAVAVVQAHSGLHLQRAAACRQHLAALVDQAANLQLHLAIAGDAAAAVIQRVAHRQRHAVRTGRLQRALLVVDATGVDAQAAVADDLAALVVERIAYVQCQLRDTLRDDLALAVAQCPGVDLHTLRRRRTAAHIQLAAGQHQCTVAEQAPFAATQRIGLHAQAPGASLLHQALAVVERGRGHYQVAVAGQRATCAVVQVRRLHRTGTGSERQQAAAAVVQHASHDVESRRTERTVAQVGVASRPVQAPHRAQPSTGTSPVTRVQREATLTGMFNAATGIADLACLQRQLRGVGGQQAAVIVEQTLHRPRRCRLAGVPQFTPAVVERLRIQPQAAGYAQRTLLVRQQAHMQRGIAMHLQRAAIIAQLAPSLQRAHSQATAAVVESGTCGERYRTTIGDAAAVIVQHAGDGDQALGHRYHWRGRRAGRAAAGTRRPRTRGTGSRRSSAAARRRAAPWATAVTTGRDGIQRTQQTVAAVAGRFGLERQRLHTSLFNGAAMVAQALRLDLQALCVELAAAVVQRAAGGDRNLARGGDGAGICKITARLQVHVLQ
ncbi:hypothetical protein LMG26824_01382 [Stenotrophomonas maltophilia]